VNETNDREDIKYKNIIEILSKFAFEFLHLVYLILFHFTGEVRRLEKEEILQSKRGKKFFFDLKIALLDNDDDLRTKREYLLVKFLNWKMKRWYTQHKRISTENKKLSLFVNQFVEKQVCRICDEKIALSKFKYHS